MIIAFFLFTSLAAVNHALNVNVSGNNQYRLMTNHKISMTRSLPINYQQKMAQAIFQGVSRYFSNNLPVGTLLAEQKVGSRSDNPSSYTIARGDTLSGIAVRHNVSVQELLRHNGLKSTRIRVGQRLKIPTS